MSVEDKIRYGRTCSLVLNKSVTVIRRVVEHFCTTQESPSFEVFLNNNKHALFHLLFKQCCCGNKGSVILLSKYHWKLLYTRSSSVNPHGQQGECPCQYTAINGVTPDVMDVSLCILVLQNICFGVSMLDVYRIKDVRNYLIYVDNASLNVTSYSATWSTVEAAMLNLAQQVSSSFRSDTVRAIKDLKDREIGPNELSALQALVMEEKRIFVNEIRNKQRKIHTDEGIRHDMSQTGRLHSASQKLDRDHRNLSVRGTDLGESLSNEFADNCHNSLDDVPLLQSSDSDHSGETPLPNYRTSTSASLKLNQFSRSTPSEMTDAYHDMMQLAHLEISSDRYNGNEKLRIITEMARIKFSSDSTIQIFPARRDHENERMIVHFINNENMEVGITKVEQNVFHGELVLTINQGLESDENFRINEYLTRHHPTCSCIELEQIDKIIEQHLDSLFANHSNLQSVSSSCIKSNDKEKWIVMMPCIVLYCSLKGYIPLEEETFPEHIENIPTDVREGYAFATGPGDVNNPLGLGCSIGAVGRGECGSLGVFTQNGRSETGFISCAHVFFSYADLKRNVEQNRREIFIETETEIKVRQPGGSVHDHSTDKVCGRVRSGWYGNIRVTDPFTKEDLDVTVDLATVQLTDRAPSRHLLRPKIDRKLRELSGLSDWPNYNFSCCQMELDDLERHVYKCGAKTNLTRGTIQMIGSTYKKGNFRDPKSPIHLKNQFEIQSCHIAETQTASSLPGVQEPFISPGDSGSVVFIRKNLENIHPIGLATGVLLKNLCGMSVPIKCFATPFFAVEAALRNIEPGSRIQRFKKRRERRCVLL